MRPVDIAELAVMAHATAKSKGWWDLQQVKTPLEQVLLMITELAEVAEEIRMARPMTEVYYRQGPGADPLKPEGIPIELADCVLRILDTCEWYGIDLSQAMLTKLAYNSTRPYRHGGKTA